MNASGQLALPLPYVARYGSGDFLAAESNAGARAWLARVEAWPQRRLALWGEAGCGKTHLLHLWAAPNGADLLTGRALGASHRSLVRPLAIDDADACDDEPALLHLLNGAAEAGWPVLLAGRAPPARWTARLPDLASRLRAMLAVGIGAAEEDLLRALLARLLAERQLAVPAPVQDWLLIRLPRAPGAVCEAVARLDRAALVAGGRITRGLAGAEIADLLNGAEAEGSSVS